MTKPRLLDLFCCAGGAGTGYARAGFEVVGVDIRKQPRYPFEFHQGDALEFLQAHGHEFDAIHASPPCQAYTAMANLAIFKGRKEEPPDLLEATRIMLQDLGKPYVIENVPGSPMQNYITLCGSEFDLIAPDLDGVPLALRRHRQFESNVFLMGAGGCRHRKDIKTGSVFGHGGGWDHRRRDTSRGGYVPHVSVCAALLGIDWPMIKRELSESIPPSYTEHLGRQLIEAL